MVGKVLEEPHVQWLEARGISASLAEKFGLYTATVSFPPDGEVDQWVRAKAIAVPYLLDGSTVNHKYRRMEPKQHVMDKGGVRCLWNMDAVKRAAGGTLVITEGEWDAMIAEDMGWAACSVPNGTPKKSSDDPANDKRYEYLWQAKDDLLKVKTFILATDADEPGIALRRDLIALLGPAKCKFVSYPAGKDLTDVRVKLGPEAAATCLNEAKPVPVEGLHRISDFPDAPPLPLTPVDIDGISIGGEEDLFGLVQSTFSVITGYPGHGKTSLVMKMIANLMLLRGKRVTLGSFETVPRPILERRLLSAMTGFSEHDPTIWRNDRARQILDERLLVIANTPDEQHELDLDRLLDLMEVAVMQHETDLVVIDPYNEIEHKRLRDETETEYAGRFIRTIKRFCHRTGAAVWLVAHPRKPQSDGAPKHPPSLYDLAGSANFYNKADYGLVVHRPDLASNEIDVIVPKVRMGLPGRVGSATLQCDPARSKYALVGIGG
jgi:twinkle protein